MEWGEGLTCAQASETDARVIDIAATHVKVLVKKGTFEITSALEQ